LGGSHPYVVPVVDIDGKDVVARETGILCGEVGPGLGCGGCSQQDSGQYGKDMFHFDV
jgi:hypothetical protein